MLREAPVAVRAGKHRRRWAAGLAAVLVLVFLVADAARTAAGTADEPVAAPSTDATSVPAVSAAPDAQIDFHEIPDVTVNALDDPSSITIVVNKRRQLSPKKFVPGDLVNLSPIPGGSSQRLTREAADALRTLHAAAGLEGLGFSISTGYRTYNHQSGVYYSYARASSYWAADQGSARPGYSEHQTGLAVDIYTSSQCRLKRCFGSSSIGLWVAEHAHEYGFVIRYPDGKKNVTGYAWEPWHLRYVGVEVAGAMHDSGVTTLEEYFGLPAAPTYG